MKKDAGLYQSRGNRSRYDKYGVIDTEDRAERVPSEERIGMAADKNAKKKSSQMLFDSVNDSKWYHDKFIAEDEDRLERERDYRYRSRQDDSRRRYSRRS